MANFWFAKLGHIVPNQLTGIDPESVVSENEKSQVRGRSVVVKKLKPLPIEAVVRGYIIGSGWKDYQKTGKVCGIELPKGLQQAQKLPEPIFTPATKAETGHDENISFDEVVKLIGKPMAEKVRDISIRLYKEASDYAATKGIIIADTKFEFGLNDKNEIVLIDEVLTADSSRFWPADSYQVGMSPPSYDKQYVRDYLETLDWDKTPPAPKLPGEVIAQDLARNIAKRCERLTGRNAFMIGIVMGSTSDWETMKAAAKVLEEFGVPYEAKAMSAHRTPHAVAEWAPSAQKNGMKAIIAAAGGAAHLAGVVAAHTTLPVLGVPMPSKHLQGLDSLLSTVQMPKGIPVATFAIGEAGAANAALFAVALLALSDSRSSEKALRLPRASRPKRC